MIISPDVIAKIKRGNTSLKNSMFKDLESIINVAKKKYEYVISSDQIDEIATDVYDRCILTFDFPEQNFQLFFSKELNKEISSLKKEDEHKPITVIEKNIVEKKPESPATNFSNSYNFKNNITPEMIYQIKKGNSSLRTNILIELMPLINNLGKKYESKISATEFNDMANQVFENCLSEFDFPEQNFSLFFVKRLSEEILAAIKNDINNKSDTNPNDVTLDDNHQRTPSLSIPTNDNESNNSNSQALVNDKIDIIQSIKEIGEIINSGELLCDIDKIANKLLSLIAHLKKIDPDDLYYVLSTLVDGNERLQIYLKTLLSANYKFNDQMLKILMNIKSTDYSSDSYEANCFKLYSAEIARYPLLSAEEEKELFIKYYNGDNKAKDILIKANLRLVIYVVKNHLNKGLDVMDLIQEGNLGLIRAVEMYDIEKSKFSSYAYRWINSKVRRSFQLYERTIKIPVNQIEKYMHSKKIVSQKEMELGRGLTSEEITEITNVDPLTRDLYNTMINQSLVSIDEGIDDKYGVATEQKKQIPDPNSDTAEEVINQMFKEKIIQCLYSSNLTEREIQIILLKFGFNNNKPITLEKIGQKMGVSRERIRVILKNALNKLRLKLEPEFDITSELTTKDDEESKITRELKQYKKNKSQKKITKTTVHKFELQQQFFDLSQSEKIAFIKKMIANKNISFTREMVANLLSIPINQVDQLIGESIKQTNDQPDVYSLHS